MKTRITEMLGIKYPIIQGAMAWVALPDLVAAVSNAGGLGILGAAYWNHNNLRKNIRLTKELTDKPFGVNFLPNHPDLEEMLDVVISEKIPVLSYGRGNPRIVIDRCKAAGIICMPTTGAMRHTVQAEQDGADIVVCQGTEGGGSTGKFGLMSFIPQAVDRVNIPVIAAGGICDGRGLASALVLGAEGILMGTRFMVTQESAAHINVKKKIIESEGEDAILHAAPFGGQGRAIPGEEVSLESVQEAKDLKKEENSSLYDSFASRYMRKIFVNGEISDDNTPAGQGAGLIRDIPTCQELIDRIMEEAEKIFQTIRF